MERQITTLFISLGLTVLSLTAAGPVQAALGEPVDSVASDEAALTTKRVSKTARSGYTVQELRSDSVTLREYVSPAGIIFAIAWNGLIHPDLTQLLGAYADEYRTTLRNVPRELGRRRQKVETNQVVVETWGQMRNLKGRCYVPALIPSGVSVDEIK